VKVAAALSRLLHMRSAPTAITVDNGGEFGSRAMEAWAHAPDVHLNSSGQESRCGWHRPVLDRGFAFFLWFLGSGSMTSGDLPPLIRSAA